ncbi:hypothetical protein [Paraburkholderia acidisoli]|uniref:hypothetical protein n=1 Tax=Paraburkholderia acidisoli TaxID=2571748 RepID=UPI001E4C1A9E|nr:hypothetical protein [Paraburkholderia acidisoli]
MLRDLRHGGRFETAFGERLARRFEQRVMGARRAFLTRHAPVRRGWRGGVRTGFRTGFRAGFRAGFPAAFFAAFFTIAHTATIRSRKRVCRHI